MRAVYAEKNVVSVCHRRAGKDIVCMQAWLLRAMRRVGTHIYLFPLQTQAREVIWNGMDFQGNPFIGYIPEPLIESKNEARMTIKLINGSRLVLAGSNNFNAHMGTNPITIINSEFSLHNPLARQYMQPILIQNNGLEICQYTPRGMNHGWDLLEQVRDDEDYFVQVLDCEHTFKHDGSRIITDKMIKNARKTMSEETIQQEFYCNFEIGNVGAYFTREIANMAQEGRLINGLPITPSLPLYTVWDLGASDATAVWLFQIHGKWVHLNHYFQDTNRPMKFFLDYAENIRKNNNCRWGSHFVPHDVDQKHQGFEHVESRLMAARNAGWILTVTPKVNFADGIEQLRFLLDHARIDKQQCQLGIKALREYSRKYDQALGKYSDKPAEGWFLHAVDALRYLAVNYKRLFLVPQGQIDYQVSGF
jgi:hypothetical protein